MTLSSFQIVLLGKKHLPFQIHLFYPSLESLLCVCYQEDFSA